MILERCYKERIINQRSLKGDTQDANRRLETKILLDYHDTRQKSKYVGATSNVIVLPYIR